MKKIRYTELQTKAEKWEKLMRKGPDGFRPCPICGRRLTMNDIQFYDCEGERIVDLETMHDYEHARDPSNTPPPRIGRTCPRRTAVRRPRSTQSYCRLSRPSP